MAFFGGFILGMVGARFLWYMRPGHDPMVRTLAEPRYEPGPARCPFMAAHECRCALPAEHTEFHTCNHGAKWGDQFRHEPNPPAEIEP